MNARTAAVSSIDLKPEEPSGVGPVSLSPSFPKVGRTGDEPGETSLAARPLGSFEHIFWLMDQNHPVHFVLAAQFTGHTTPHEWRRALDCVQKRHPLLSVCIRPTPGSIPEFRRVTPAPIPLRVVVGDPESRWNDEVSAELATPFQPGQAPLVRAVLIHGAQQAALVLAAHHSIADALSLAFVIRDTLQAINGAPLAPLPFSSTQEQALGLSDAAIEGAAAPRVVERGVAGQPAIYRPRDGGRPKVRGLRLSVNLTRRIRTRAREEGTSLHGALCAALVIAGRQTSVHWRNTPVRILSPINTRSMLGVGESCGVYVSSASHTFEMADPDFWSLARLAKKGIAAAMAREQLTTLLAGLQQTVHRGLDVAGAGQLAATAFAREAMLTNLGALPFGGQTGRIKLESLWGPAVLSGFEGEQTIGAATVDGVLCLTQTSHTPSEGLLEAMWATLIEACPEVSEVPLLA